VITVFYKASIHSLAACGMLGILLPMNKAVEDGSLLYPLLGVMLLTGLVLSARLQLQAHTPRQVLVGATAGFAASFITMVLLF
jgi:membrane-associated phospholipid phosphatase